MCHFYTRLHATTLYVLCCISRAVQQNTLVLNEECESLRQKLNRAEERTVKLATLEVECEVSINDIQYNLQHSVVLCGCFLIDSHIMNEA